MTNSIPKFRAFDHKTNTIRPVIAILWDEKGNPDFIAYRFHDKSEDPYWEIDFDLIPSTGLFDKNNKEIFAGDILLYIAPKNKNKDRKTDEYHYHEVVWNPKGQWDIKRMFKGRIVVQFRLGKSGSQGKGFEIAGNIYKNKKLLK